jgi:hypothetical protein
LRGEGRRHSCNSLLSLVPFTTLVLIALANFAAEAS